MMDIATRQAVARMHGRAYLLLQADADRCRRLYEAAVYMLPAALRQMIEADLGMPPLREVVDAAD